MIDWWYKGGRYELGGRISKGGFFVNLWSKTICFVVDKLMKIDFVEYMFTLWFIDDQHELGMNQMEEYQRVVYQ